MKIISIKATAAKAGVSTRSIYNFVSNGTFPRPIQLTSKRVGWLESEVDDWIRAKVAERDRVAA